MPEIGPYSYVINMLMDVGPIDLTWKDLESWNRITQMNINGWEFRTLKRLANIYTANSRSYSGLDSISPFVQESGGEKLERNVRSALHQPLGKGIK